MVPPPNSGDCLIFVRPSDAAFLLGVSRQSLWDRIRRGTVQTSKFDGGEWVCLSFAGDNWCLAEPLPEEQQRSNLHKGGPIEAVHVTLNLL